MRTLIIIIIGKFYFRMVELFEIEIKINENLDTEIKEITLKIRPEWSNKPPMETVCVRSGITNSLFACYLKSTGLNHHETILYRIYNDKSEKLINRTSEIEAMCLTSEMGLGPKYFGKFKNGILYEFLTGSILDLEKQFHLSEEKLVKFCEEVNMFSLASHLVWGLWSLVQAQISEFDYDFVSYSYIRFKEYYKRKKDLSI